MICLNMEQQPPRLEVASGLFKHLGQGVQLRLWLWIAVHGKASFYKGMTEFQEGEVSVICRKIILIHGQGPGFCYLQVKRFK